MATNTNSSDKFFRDLKFEMSGDSISNDYGSKGRLNTRKMLELLKQQEYQKRSTVAEIPQ
jgi:hypothetical protein